MLKSHNSPFSHPANPSRAPREAFAVCETAPCVAGNFRNVRNRGACRGKLSQHAKPWRVSRETFAVCETVARVAGSFRNVRKSAFFGRLFFAVCESLLIRHLALIVKIYDYEGNKL